MLFGDILAIAAAQGGGAAGYAYTNAEASALVARMSVAPDDTRKGLIDTFVGSLKSGGVWSLLDVLYVLAAHDSQASLLNWIGASHNGVTYGAPVFTTDRGWQGAAGVADGINTDFNPTSAAGNFTLAEASVWEVMVGSTVFTSDCGWTDAATRLIPRSSGALTAQINGGTSIGSGTTSGTRFVGVRQHTSGGTDLETTWKDGAQNASAINTAIALPNTNFTIGGQAPSTASTSGRVIKLCAAGGYLDDTKAAAFYSAAKTFLNAIGNAVT